MKKYRVYASQQVIYYKEVEAKSKAQAEELAWEGEDSGWQEVHFGDWQMEEGTEEVKNA